MNHETNKTSLTTIKSKNTWFAPWPLQVVWKTTKFWASWWLNRTSGCGWWVKKLRLSVPAIFRKLQAKQNGSFYLLNRFLPRIYIYIYVFFFFLNLVFPRKKLHICFFSSIIPFHQFGGGINQPVLGPKTGARLPSRERVPNCYSVWRSCNDRTDGDGVKVLLGCPVGS